MRRIDFLAPPDEHLWLSFARYRRTEPVLWAEPIRMYCVFRYADIKTCLTSPSFTVEYPFRVSRQVFGQTLLDIDGAAHSRLRRRLAELLLGRADNVPFDGSVGQCVQDAIDTVSALPGFDFVQQIGGRLPTEVTATFLGVPEQERGWVFNDLSYLLDHLDGSSRDFEVAGRLRTKITALVRRLIDDGGTPDGSVISELRADVLAGAIDAADAIGLVLMILAAGVKTSTGILCNTMVTIAQFPQWRERITTDREALARFVREVVRWEPPQTDTVRFARHDTELGGVPIAAGKALKLLLASGNRDEAAFIRGEEFDPDRPQRSSLSFGHGHHSCLGTHMALTLAMTFFAEFLRRCPNVRVVEPVPKIEGWSFRSPPVLPMVATAPPSATRRPPEWVHS
jgi:cytochrome P450